jgi:hypothetical protein
MRIMIVTFINCVELVCKGKFMSSDIWVDTKMKIMFKINSMNIESFFGKTTVARLG